MIPCVPFLPFVPFGPRLPRGPGGPGRQTLPGARQKVLTRIEFTYFLIPSRISYNPAESLLFSFKLRRTISLFSTGPARQKLHYSWIKPGFRKVRQPRNLYTTKYVENNS